MRDPLRHHHAHRQALPASSRAERSAERFADFLGTVTFPLVSSLFIVLWILVNAVGVGVQWDPYPFILLNLGFSAFAFYAASLVIIAQKAQRRHDRVDEQAAADHREELHRESMHAVESLRAQVDLAFFQGRLP
jgi:uncharacterized membrane protein